MGGGKELGSRHFVDEIFGVDKIAKFLPEEIGVAKFTVGDFCIDERGEISVELQKERDLLRVPNSSAEKKLVTISGEIFGSERLLEEIEELEKFSTG